MPDPVPPSQGDTFLEQTTTGDRNQAIGQVLGGIVVYVSGGQAVFHSASTESDSSAPKPTSSDIGPNPYKGLMVFQEMDGDRFFGREKQISALWEKLRSLHETESAIRILPIYGPSGSGKSSLARAGLIPELARHPIRGYNRARAAVLVPGTHPLESLATVLARIVTQDLTPVTKTREFAGELKQVNEAGEYDGLRRIANVMPDGAIAPLVVLVDQFEEVYTLCKDTAEREAFVGNLLNAAGDRVKRVTVILTLRSDFLGETQKHAVLNRLFSEQGYLVPAMTLEELQQAIAKPAELAGHPLDVATIDLLVKDTEGREGALPLLQFALTRIWEGLAEGKPPAETLKAIGGVGGALAGEAQRIYDSLDEEGRVIARRLFLGLVQLGEGTKDTRRRALLDSLVSYQDQPAQVKQVIDLFASPGVRLITLSANGNTETAEVTHEALFDHWQQLQGWLEGGRSNIRFQRRLDEAARYWHEQGRPEGNLWRPPDLSLLKRYQQQSPEDLTPLQIEFFRASERSENHRKWLRRFGISSLAAGLVFTIGTTIFALSQLQRAERQRVDQLAALGTSLLSTEPTEGLVHAIAAVGLSQSPFVRFPNHPVPSSVQSSLLDAIQAGREQNIFWHGARVLSVAFSPNGQQIVSSGENGTIRLWDLQGRPIGQPFGEEGAEIRSVAFSPEGEYIVSGSLGGSIRLWDLQGNRLERKFRGHSALVHSVVFSPNGKYIASGSADGTIRLWDLQGNQIGNPFKGHKYDVYSVAFSANGQRLISNGKDGTVRLWNLQGNQVGEPLQADRFVLWSIAFNPVKDIFVSGGADTLRIGGDVEQLQWFDRSSFDEYESKVLAVAFSPDGQRIISGSMDGILRLRNVSGDQIGLPIKGHSGWITSVAFSPDGQHVVSGSGDGTLRLWDLQDSRLWNAQNSEVSNYPLKGMTSSFISAAAINPVKQQIAAVTPDGTVSFWNLQGLPVGRSFKASLDPTYHVAFSPNGELMASSDRSEAVQLQDLTGNLIGDPIKSDSISSLTFGHDGQHIITSSSNGINLWNLQGKIIRQFSLGNDSTLSSVAFSPDGQHIVSGSFDGLIKLWNAQGNQIWQSSVGVETNVHSVVFSADGQRIVSIYRGNDTYDSLRLWSIDGTPIGSSFGKGTIYAAAFSSDGQHIITIGSLLESEVITINQWSLSWETWLKIGCERLQHHTILINPQTDIAKQAKQTCQRYVWNNQ